MTDQHTLNFKIADTLEKIQPINPELYGLLYSRLYPPHGDKKHWNMQTLNLLNTILASGILK